MRIGRRSNLLVCAAVWMAAALAASGAIALQEVSAEAAWVELPGEGESTARAFVTIKNPTMYDAYLVSATSDVAGKLEIRKATEAGESALVAELTVPAYGSIAMTPEGSYLLLSDLKRPLKEGETITLRLKTDASTLEVEAVVRAE